jgi:hypothetical protein
MLALLNAHALRIFGQKDFLRISLPEVHDGKAENERVEHFASLEHDSIDHCLRRFEEGQIAPEEDCKERLIEPHCTIQTYDVK